MGSNTVTNFLTKLLRPDKKAKQKQPEEDTRRYSSPVPEWASITQISSTTEPNKKSNLKGKRDGRHSSQPNLAEVKKQKNSNAKKVDSKRRKSSAFHSLFCVSGNVDTLDRVSLPPQPKDVNNKSVNNKNYEKRSNVYSEISGDRLRKVDGKKNRNNKNRYSAPPTADWTEGKTANSKENSSRTREDTNNLQNRTTQRELSPGVRYRFDGTLEKPYVFPAGLTFGPEGRKLQLRRSTSTEISGKHRNKPLANGKVVKVDVHRSSTENVLFEYSYEDSCPDPGEFDVGKAFYLKFDSDLSQCADDNEPDVQDNRWKPRVDSTRRREHRQSRRRENRYSMPPKNEDFVYMGSFENIDILSHLVNDNEVSKSSFDCSGKERDSTRNDTVKNRRNRYSLPPRNSELVYMGSLENVNYLINKDKDNPCELSVACEEEKTDVYITNTDRKYGNEKSVKEAEQSKQDKRNHGPLPTSSKERLLVDLDRSVGGHNEADSKNKLRDSETDLSSKNFKRHSMPELVLPTELSISKNRSSAFEGSEFDYEEEHDSFDTTYSYERKKDRNQNNPFSRGIGRSSCMPGNKRSMDPPPAVFNPPSKDSSNCVSFSTNTDTRRDRYFSIPPPPNYTPPKEEMENTLARLKEYACHKGSQTDLHLDFDYLNMEDRDSSLRNEEIKTLFAGISTKKGLEKNKETCHTRDHITKDNTHKYISDRSHSTELSRGLLDVSDVSVGSDDVFKSQNNNNFTSKHEFKSKSKNGNKPPESCIFKSNTSNQSTSSFVKARAHHIYEEIPDCLSKRDFSDNSHDNTSIKLSGDSANNQHHQSLSSDPGSSDVSWKPVPYPRKLSTTSSHNETSLLSNENPTQKFDPDTSANTRNPPVPKKRHSLALNRSLSMALDSGKHLEEFSRNENSNKDIPAPKLSRTQSDVVCSTLERGRIISLPTCGQVNDKRSTGGDNDYEEIDSFYGRHENIYEECGNAPSSGKTERTNVHNISSTKNSRTAASQRYEYIAAPMKKYKPTSWSMSQIPTRETMRPGKIKPNREHHYDLCVPLGDWDDNDDNADDEMSLSNEDEEDEVVDGKKKYSLRRCVSADDLLRSGSIIDRSMILAKKRRKRMQERKSKSKRSFNIHQLSDSNPDWTTRDILPKNLYSKRRTTSNERIYKHKANHTDSGHDSGTASPCTSPDSRRHVDKITLQVFDSQRHVDKITLPESESQRNVDKITLEDSEQLLFDAGDSYIPALGTLPKKPWEIRLRNKQNLRKSKSKENLTISNG